MEKKGVVLQFLAVPFAVYLLVIIIPFLQSLYLSLTDWNGISETFDFVGLANYLLVFSDRAFSAAVLHNFIWVTVFLLLPTLLGLLLAVLLDKDIRGAVVFKSIIYLPMIFSYVIAGMVWTFIYEPRLGILNLSLEAAGLPQLTRAWLAEPGTALLSVIVAAAWQHTGLCMILFLAGLQSVRADLIEAAEIDGANRIQLFLGVVLPQLKNTTIVVVSLTVINSLKSFDIVYIMTRGGPFRSSEVLTTLMYREAFWNYRMGYGSAIANMLFFMVLIIIVVYFRSVMQRNQT
ncbi:MAG: sugar ABC transporter permease [Spirochaetaceae bacterium]|nr:MAG: sugar ABC transporter permease [Spirochaetaceae bacterium]